MSKKSVKRPDKMAKILRIIETCRKKCGTLSVEVDYYLCEIEKIAKI